MSKKKEKKWCHFRHLVVVAMMRIVMWPILRIKYGFHYKRFQHDKRNYLILFNHQTTQDQFFVGYLFKNKTYYVTSDDFTTIPFVSWLLKVLVHIIPYKKASTDFGILKNCKQVASENGNIAIAPEGNRCYSGKTGYINPTIAKMIKFLKLPVAFVLIKGGFGVMPRFSKKPRRGRCTCEVTRVWEYDEYKDLSYEAMYEVVKKEMWLDESVPDNKFTSKKKAEFLERVIYLCPNCGVVHFASHGDILECPKCHAKLKYTDYKQFEVVEGNYTFKNVSDWYDYQRKALFKFNMLELDNNVPLFDDKIKLFEVVPRKTKKKISLNAHIVFFPNRLEITYDENKLIINLDEINSSGVFGDNKVNFFTNNHTYQIKYDDRFNGLKYVQYYYKYKMDKGENNEQFFGI